MSTFAARHRSIIDSEFIALATSAAGEAANLSKAACYVAESGGKRLRGLLALAIAADLGVAGSSEELVMLAVGLEAIHAASLVHDDLPALDNDDFRRGRPSCHKAFGEATAVLTGDYLLGLAFRVINEGNRSAEQKVALSAELSSTWISLCVGQQLDLTGVRGDMRQRMLELKTGALFGCAAAWGAIAGSADRSHIAEFRAWGTRLGILFQWLDDISDGDGEHVMRERIDAERSALEKEIASLFTSGGSYTREITSLALL